MDVALSLWRRNTDPELRRDPWLAFRAWERYNRRLLAFSDRHPERRFVAHAPALAADLAGFVRRVGARLDLPFEIGDFQALYDPEELAPSCQPPRPAWEGMIPEALALYGRLEETADLPSAEEPAASGRQRELLQGNEVLLYTFLERLRLQEEELRQRSEAAAEEVRVLKEIEGSRSFVLIRSWWWLRRRLQSIR